MEPIIYSGLIGLLLGLAAAIVAGAAGYTLGQKHEREKILPESMPFDEDPNISRLLREHDLVEVRRVPSYYRTHSGSAMMLLAMTLATACAWPSSVESASKACGMRGDILKNLEAKHLEVPNALGLSSDGGVLEILTSPQGGWTILLTYPKRPTCVVAVGKAWEVLPPVTSGGIQIGDAP